MTIKIVVTIDETETGIATRITRKGEGASGTEQLLSGMIMKAIDFLASPSEDDGEDEE